jgi:hypothetical protein
MCRVEIIEITGNNCTTAHIGLIIYTISNSGMAPCQGFLPFRKGFFRTRDRRKHTPGEQHHHIMGPFFYLLPDLVVSYKYLTHSYKRDISIVNYI